MTTFLGDSLDVSANTADPSTSCGKSGKSGGVVRESPENALNYQV